MATVPAESDPSAANQGLLSSLGQVPMWRQLLFMVGLAGSIAIGFALVLWSQEPDYQPVVSNRAGYAPGEVLQVLQLQGIQYRVEPNDGTILVSTEELARARLELAAAGITGDAGVGLEILDKDQSLGTSQFVESARYQRGLEGELGRTISSLQPVRTARVHLAIPKSAVFVRDPRRPSASVLVELYPGRNLSPNQVQAIVNMVASSVSQMEKEDVTVVDQRGGLLSTLPAEEDRTMALAQKQFAYTRQLEELLISRVHNILEPILGGDNYKAEISADVDFTQQEQTAESFNPDAPALRSEQTLSQSRGAGEATGGIPGALSNQPPGEVAVPEVAVDAEGNPVAGSEIRDSRTEATRNYELDKTISYTRHQQGQLKRLSVAVVINNRSIENAETGEKTPIPWTETELTRLNRLVEDAVGYDVSRGDSVNVINTAFVDYSRGEAAVTTQFWEQAWFWDIGRQILIGIFMLILLFGFIRPMVRSLLGKDKVIDEDDLADVNVDMLADVEGGAPSGRLASPSGLMLPSPQEGYEEQLTAVKGLIAEDPQRVAEVIKRWVGQDE